MFFCYLDVQIITRRLDQLRRLQSTVVVRADSQDRMWHSHFLVTAIALLAVVLWHINRRMTWKS